METCTCHTTNHIQVNAAKYDPSRTLGLQNTFARELRRRFINLEKVIIQAVVTQDCFGLNNKMAVHKSKATPPGDKAFAYTRSSDKLVEFEKWLQRQIDNEILEVTEMSRVGQGVEGAWTNKYITDSYKRGIIRSRYEMQKAGMAVPGIEKSGGVNVILGSTPMHLDRVGLLYTRVFSDLKGITAAMDTQISRVLAQGIADGDNPRLLARKLLSTINGTGMGDLSLTDTLGRFVPARTRAEMLARTEVIRAHHMANVQEYRNWKVLGVTVEVEWKAGLDNRVCPICKKLDGRIFTLDEIEPMIPAHPRCRCSIVPHIVKPEKKPEIIPTKKLEFKEAETIEDARLWAKENLNIEISTKNKLPLNVLNTINKNLFTLQNTYGKTPDAIVSFTGTNDYASVYSFKGKVNMGFNEKYFINIKKIEKALTSDVATKYHPIGCNTVKSVVDHEYAHLLTRNFISIKGHDVNSVIYKEFNDIWNRYNDEISNDMQLLKYRARSSHPEYISAYSNKELGEFVSEGFAMALNNENPSKYANEILNTINKYFKK